MSSLRISSYPSNSLVTVESREAAKEKGLGACSRFQDLVVYMTMPDLTKIGISCGLWAIIDFEKGVVCHLEFGFTLDCARTWIYNTQNT